MFCLKVQLDFYFGISEKVIKIYFEFLNYLQTVIIYLFN